MFAEVSTIYYVMHRRSARDAGAPDKIRGNDCVRACHSFFAGQSLASPEPQVRQR